MLTLIEAKPDEKLTHYTVDYISWNGMPGHTCGNCSNLIDGQQPRCKIVADSISRDGWCMKWEKQDV